MALNNKQQMFLNEYLKTFNATKAAKLAGYSEKTAYSQGHDLLKHPEISEAIRARLNESAMEANEVLYHLAEIGRGDFDDITDANGNLDMEKARELGKTRLIKKVKQRTVTTADKDGAGSDITETEVEIHDRVRALELIGKYHKLFTDKTEITGADGSPIPILVTGMDVDEL